ncbi:uncharacterized protein L3040_005905 [Drepanopeziza brunnea f. sp. 'multigermtubi']|uniref:uncharacterized protein n=1 Tax=Drepanopeziza brunnea f. sp. 'multigermtubi' TaxID=698441 RepID=UPI00238F5FB6|nr:hypothetical protein L3040_005905 [Drepanopeziza brunnea f. sp. 'multigermtubi']
MEGADSSRDKTAESWLGRARLGRSPIQLSLDATPWKSPRGKVGYGRVPHGMAGTYLILILSSACSAPACRLAFSSCPRPRRPSVRVRGRRRRVVRPDRRVALVVFGIGMASASAPPSAVRRRRLGRTGSPG